MRFRLPLILLVLAAPPFVAQLAAANPPGAGPAPEVDAGASAQPSASQPAPAPPPSTPATISPSPGGWPAKYTAARTLLLDGEFELAAQAFNRLALETDNPVDKALALNQAQLALEWSRRGVSFVGPGTGAARVTHGPRKGERSADELALLYTHGIAYGIGTGVWLSALGGAFDNNGTAAAQILPALIFGGAGAGAVALLDSGKPLRYGIPQAIVSGLYIGLEQGIVWTLWNQGQSANNQITDDKVISTLIWGFSTAGAVGGGLLGSALGVTPGRASWVGSTALWTGTIVGLLSAAATGDSCIGCANDRQVNGFFAAGVGLNVGTAVGLLTASDVSPSIARVRFLDIGGIAGGLAVGGLYAAAADTNSNTQAGLAATALGMAGGLAIAWVVTNGMPRDVPATPAAPEPRGFTWHPTLIPMQGAGAGFGIVGGM